jgi:dephospho-CoA kinase
MVIGVTGGIGSGKSTVTEILLENGFKSIISDDVAKDLMVSDQKVIDRIISNFGKRSYNNGQLDKSYLADQVFNNPENIKIINSIVHPPTIEKIESLIAEQKRRDKDKLIFVESALIFEAKMEYLFDHILLVTADEDIRIKRILKRGVETISEIRSRMMNQIPEIQKRKRSQFIIENNSTLKSLKEKTLFFLNLFKSMTEK